jgi:ribosomal protein S18 acetylase RimI-like enzyme
VTVLDIALLPEWRGRGIGTALMRAVCEETAAAGKAVSVAVEKFNRAQTLYRRLGFRETQDEGIYWFMEWRQAAEDAAADPAQLNTA